MIAAGMVTRPAIHPIPKSCRRRRRRYDGSTRAQDGRSRTRSSRNKTKTRLCPAATTTSNAGPATNHSILLTTLQADSPSSSGIRTTSNQTVPSTSCRTATRHHSSTNRTAAKPINQSSSTSQAPMVRIAFAQRSHRSSRARRQELLLLRRSFQFHARRQIPAKPQPQCLPALIVLCSPFPQDHRIPQPGNQQGQGPKKKHKYFYSAHIARQFYTQGPASPTRLDDGDWVTGVPAPQLPYPTSTQTKL